MEKNKLTTRAMGELCGIHHSTIHHIISGRNKTTSYANMQKIIKATKGRVTLEDLAAGSEMEPR